MLQMFCFLGLILNAVVFLVNLGTDLERSAVALFCGIFCYIGYIELKPKGE